MQLYARLGDARRVARAQQTLAFALCQMGELDEAQTLNAEALTASRACGDAVNVADLLNTRAAIDSARGDVGAARDGFMLAVAASKALGDETSTAVPLCNLAELEFAEGHPELALRLLGEALQINRREKNAAFIASCHTNTAAYRVALGDLAGARESARDGLRVARQGRIELVIAIALQHLAVVAAFGGDGQSGAQLLGYVDAQCGALGIQRGPTERWGHDKLIKTLRETLSDDEIAQLSAEGAAWSEDRAVEEALR